MRKKLFPIFLISILIVLALVLSLYPQAAFAQASAYQEDFEDGQAQGWELESGWKVIADGSNQVLAGEGHYWARSNQSFTSDYRLSFRLKLQRGTIHIIYRLNDVGRYYIGFQPDGTYLSKQYWPDDFHENLAVSQTPHSYNTWYQIHIVSHGDSFDFYVNDTLAWSYTDPQPLGIGSFAFETIEDSLAYVDDIRVYLTNEQPAAPTSAGQINPTLSPSQLTWIRTGGPLGGLGYDIRMRPDNPDIMYATDAYAGLHKSTDGGQTWFPSNDGITGRQGESGDDIPVFCLMIDPNNYDIVWSGLQWLGQIYRSEDGGNTWEKRSTGIIGKEGLSFRGITVEPGNSSTVYAAAEISPVMWAGQNMRGLGFDMTKGVLYKSTDAGLHWTAVWQGDNLARYIWIDPTNVQTIYLSTGIFDREAANSDPETRTPGGVGILKSMDGGKTWDQINYGLGNLYVGSLFMHPTNPNILLAGAGNNIYREGSGVYLTVDGGANWKLVMDTEIDPVTSVEFATSNPNIAYAGGQNTFAFSTDAGQTWQRRERSPWRWGPVGVAPGFPIDFQVDPRDPQRIFTNNYGGGNFLSEDGGKTWISSSTGYTGADLRSLAVDPRYSALVYTNGRSGPFISQDGGSLWEGINPDELAPIVEGSQITIDPENPNHLLMTESNGTADYAGRILWSEDSGRTWNDSTTDWSNLRQQDATIIGGVEALAFAPGQSSRVYAVFGNNGCKGFGQGCDSPQLAVTIAVSNDGGRSWKQVTSLGDEHMPGTAVVVDPENADHAWVAIPNDGIFETRDGGMSWQSDSDGYGSARVISLAVDPSNRDILYAGTGDNGAYKSLDGGETWQRSSYGMDPTEPVFTIAINPNNSNILYAGSMRSGVFQSTDAGKTWVKLNNGLTMRTVHDLVISSDGLTLYATTHGGGIFRLDLENLPPAAAPAPASTATSIPAALLATKTSEAASTAIPNNLVTATPEANTGICGSALAFPLGLLGLAWWQVLKKREKR